MIEQLTARESIARVAEAVAIAALGKLVDEAIRATKARLAARKAKKEPPTSPVEEPTDGGA